SYWQTELKERHRMFHIETHQDGSSWAKLAKFVKAVISWCFLRVKVGRAIVHVHTSVGASFARKFFFVVTAKLTGCRVILHIHSGSFAHYYKSGNRLLKKAITFALNQADTVIVLSESWVPVVSSIAPGCRRIRVVGNPIDIEKYRP